MGVPTSSPASTASPSRWPHRLSVAVLVVVLLVVGLVSWTARSVYEHGENRLLDLKAKEAASVLSNALPGVETPLASAAALAEATDGDPAKFEQFMGTYVGSTGPFVSASIWVLATPGTGPVATVGQPPALAADPGRATAFFAQATRSPKLNITGILPSTGTPHLGYEFNSPGSSRYAAYAETALPANRRLRIASDAAFSDLGFALYLGHSTRPADLLGASVALPAGGRQRTTVVPFGNSAFTMVVKPKGPLGGALPARLPWIIAIAGALLAVVAAAATERLVRRRQTAEQLAVSLDLVAAENRRLYTEQRSLAQTLQQVLLPEVLAAPPGVDASARYVAGVKGIEIGGDWYDLIRLDDKSILFVVGDVSGRGLRAAADMASLRFAVRAYAAEGDDPSTILSKLSELLSVDRNGHYATVLCGRLDVDSHQITLANAGHLPPLLITGGTGEFVATDVGVPVGVAPSPMYTSVTVKAPAGATLLAFTDGLVERRGESLDVSLDRVRTLVSIDVGSLDQLMTSLVESLKTGTSEDDTAILGVRWRN
jgi:serine phosphatase RsbU (regulator of sigma subunit)